jgi:hypothetical protein
MNEYIHLVSGIYTWNYLFYKKLKWHLNGAKWS